MWAFVHIFHLHFFFLTFIPPGKVGGRHRFRLGLGSPMCFCWFGWLGLELRKTSGLVAPDGHATSWRSLSQVSAFRFHSWAPKGTGGMRGWGGFSSATSACPIRAGLLGMHAGSAKREPRKCCPLQSQARLVITEAHGRRRRGKVSTCTEARSQKVPSLHSDAEEAGIKRNRCLRECKLCKLHAGTVELTDYALRREQVWRARFPPSSLPIAWTTPSAFCRSALYSCMPWYFAPYGLCPLAQVRSCPEPRRAKERTREGGCWAFSRCSRGGHWADCASPT